MIFRDVAGVINSPMKFVGAIALYLVVLTPTLYPGEFAPFVGLVLVHFVVAMVVTSRRGMGFGRGLVNTLAEISGLLSLIWVLEVAILIAVAQSVIPYQWLGLTRLPGPDGMLGLLFYTLCEAASLVLFVVFYIFARWANKRSLFLSDPGERRLVPSAEIEAKA